MSEQVAILIVNGGKDPENGKWLKLCLEKIREYTEWKNYIIYVWNNNIEDDWVINYLKELPKVRLFQAEPDEKLDHIHASALQKLYEKALQESPTYIVTMDSDAHPIQKGWLTKLINSLNDEYVLAGVWRDELKKAISPYIHASCLCTTVDFIKNNTIRLDFIAQNTPKKIHDTLSIMTEKADKLGLKTFKLVRSNKNNFHRLMGGIYGDLIYHHGAGSRQAISFWDEPSDQFTLQEKNGQLAGLATELLFNYYKDYMNWLKKESQPYKDPNFTAQLENLKKIQSSVEFQRKITNISAELNRIQETAKQMKKIIQKKIKHKIFDSKKVYFLKQTARKFIFHNPLFLDIYQKQKIKTILLSNKSIKLHLGCGDEHLKGYINIDSYPDSKADLVMNAITLDLLPNDCADVIESYHFFEHLQVHEAQEAIREWYRVLKPGGTIIIELPNLEVCAQEIGKHFNPKDGMDLAMAGIFSYPSLVKEQGYGMIHKWGWTPSTLSQELITAGFIKVRQHPIKQTWRLGTSWNRDMQIRAEKP